jgi:hypothetical protein
MSRHLRQGNEGAEPVVSGRKEGGARGDEWTDERQELAEYPIQTSDQIRYRAQSAESVWRRMLMERRTVMDAVAAMT